MTMVNAAVLLGIILPMVVTVTVMPVAIVKACLLMTMPSIPFVVSGSHCEDYALMGSVALTVQQHL